MAQESGGQQPSNGLAKRIVRYRDLVPCRNAFIDTRSPGSEAKENFTIIGPGVSENPEQHIHIAEPHGFNIGGARQPPRCVNSQHSHDTAETFVVHSGRWRFTFGEHGQDSAVEGGPGDIVSFPVHAFRGFENVGDDLGFLWSVLGGDDPGRVLWAPQVFDLARDHGLILLENGALVDTNLGQQPPPGIAPMPRTSAEQVAALRRLDQTAAGRMIVAAEDRSGETEIALGIAAWEVIGDGGRFDWDHGFAVTRLRMAAGATWDVGERAHPHVLFVQTGEVRVRVDEELATIGAGDTLTIPVTARRTIEAAAESLLFAVERRAP